MLSPAEQTLFRRLATFQGTFSLPAAEAVGAFTDAERSEVLDALARLIDHSLVQVVEEAGETRYRLLQTVRHYGQDKLAASGEAAAVHAAQTGFLVELAGEAQAGLAGPDQARWLERLDAEHDNLRVALERELPAAPEIGGRLAGLLWPFWWRRGRYLEGRMWLEQAAARADELAPGVRVDVLTGAGVLAFLQCDYPIAIARLQDALRLDEELGDRAGAATALQGLGSIAREQGRYADARRLHERSQAVWAELGDPRGVATAQDYLGFAAWLEGDYTRAEALERRRAGDVPRDRRGTGDSGRADQPRRRRPVSRRQRVGATTARGGAGDLPRDRLPGGHRLGPARAGDPRPP